MCRLAVLFLFTASVLPVAPQVIDCGKGKSLFLINSQDFQPNPPIVGQDATLWIDYTVPEGVSIAAGTAKYSITLSGIPYPATVDDLCADEICPQVSGTYNITNIQSWSGGVSGKIVSKIEWFDTASSLLLCSQTTIRV